MTMLPFQLPPGVVRGSSDTTSKGRWWDTNLVRWRGKALQPVGGWERLSASPLPTTPRRVLSWVDLQDIRHTAILCDDNILVTEGSGYTDRTPADFQGDTVETSAAGFGIGLYSAGTFGSPRAASNIRLFLRASAFCLDTFGEDLLVLASSDGRLLVCDPAAATPAAPVAAAPFPSRAMLVTDERHVMLFGAGGNPRRIAWCSRENYNDWDFANVTNSAGYIDIDCPGWIVNAVKVRGGVLVFTDSEVWFGRYRGEPFIYGFERIGQTCAMIAPMAYVTTGGICAWMGREGFWIYDGGVVRPLQCDVEDYIFGEIDPVASQFRPHAVNNGLFSEFWFFYPSKGATECDRYACWCYTPNEQWWAIGALSRTAACDAGIYPYPVMTGPDRHVYQHESGWLDAGLPRVGTIYAETGALSFPVSGERTAHVMAAQMDTRYGNGLVDLTMFVRDTRDGTEVTAGPYVARSDGWMETRVNARDFRFRLTGRADGDFTIGEMRFDVRQGSKR